MDFVSYFFSTLVEVQAEVIVVIATKKIHVTMTMRKI